MSEPTTCGTTVWDSGGWASHACERPIKRDGMCGLHAAVKDRREKKRAEDNAQQAREVEEQIRTQRLCVRLEAMGVKVAGTYQNRYALIEPGDLLALLTTEDNSP